MANQEKCFCHLNGYKVKDADARASIELLETEITSNTNDIDNLYDIVHEEFPEVKERISALENGAGGSSLYCHTIQFKKDGDYIRFSFLSTKITSKFNTFNDLKTWLYDNGYGDPNILKTYPAIGNYGGVTGSGNGVIIGIYADGFANLYARCRNGSVLTEILIAMAYVEEFTSECFEI